MAMVATQEIMVNDQGVAILWGMDSYITLATIYHLPAHTGKSPSVYHSM